MQLETQLQVVIEGLKYAINENYMAIDDPDKGYPYAAGYSRSACKTAAEQLESIIKWYISNDNESTSSCSY